jgi:hypothetical protein
MVRAMRLAVPAMCLLAACGPTRGEGDDDDTPLDARVDARAGDAAPGDTSEELPSRVYAHSGTTLYQVDTATLTTTRIGDFTNLGAQTMLDLAVDRDERMIGVTRDKIFEIDETTAATTFLADFGAVRGFSSLSFVPQDPANPDGPEC